MKFENVTEAPEGTLDFGAAREKRMAQRAKMSRFDDRQAELKKQQEWKAKNFSQIEHAVAATIDQLAQQGMDFEEAQEAVYKHLSDMVMAQDLG